MMCRYLHSLAPMRCVRCAGSFSETAGRPTAVHTPLDIVGVPAVSLQDEVLR